MPPPPRPHYTTAHAHQTQQQNYDTQPYNDRSTISSTNTVPSTRQTSGNSSIADSTTTASSHTTANSGSENWETFGDSDAEDEDVTPGPRSSAKRADDDSYPYARAQAQGYLGAAGGTIKAPTGGGGGVYAAASKKAKAGLPGAGRVGMEFVDNGTGGRRMGVEGSDAGWTDEDVY